MLAVVRGPESAKAIDLPASVEWTMTDLRRHGEARVEIPRDSLLWDEEIIADKGGFFFEIYTSFGIWRGVSDVPEYTETGASIVVRNLTHWMTIRNVGRNVTYYGLTAGAIAREAIRQGILTILPITVGTILEAAPIVPEYTFNGQTVIQVLNDLSDLTNQTWEIDEHYQFNWLPRQGNHHEIWIVDDGKILPKIQLTTLNNTFAEVIETDDAGRQFSAFTYTHPLWPKQDGN